MSFTASTMLSFLRRGSGGMLYEGHLLIPHTGLLVINANAETFAGTLLQSHTENARPPGSRLPTGPMITSLWASGMSWKVAFCFPSDSAPTLTLVTIQWLQPTLSREVWTLTKGRGLHFQVSSFLGSLLLPWDWIFPKMHTNYQEITAKQRLTKLFIINESEKSWFLKIYL